MIVIVLSNCPHSLRGDITKWMFEISTNVFVGKLSSRVRDELWERILESSLDGIAVMVFGVDSEQRFDFRILNSNWKIKDYDGLKIMVKPNSSHKSNISFDKK